MSLQRMAPAIELTLTGLVKVKFFYGVRSPPNFDRPIGLEIHFDSVVGGHCLRRGGVIVNHPSVMNGRMGCGGLLHGLSSVRLKRE